MLEAAEAGKPLKRAPEPAAADPPTSAEASSPKLSKTDHCQPPADTATLQQENDRLREQLERFSQQIEDFTIRNQALILQNSKLKAAEEAMKNNLNWLAMNQLNAANAFQSFAAKNVLPAATSVFMQHAAPANKALYQQMAYNAAMLNSAATLAPANFGPITFVSAPAVSYQDHGVICEDITDKAIVPR